MGNRNSETVFNRKRYIFQMDVTGGWRQVREKKTRTVHSHTYTSIVVLPRMLEPEGQQRGVIRVQRKQTFFFMMKTVLRLYYLGTTAFFHSWIEIDWQKFDTTKKKINPQQQQQLKTRVKQEKKKKKRKSPTSLVIVQVAENNEINEKQKMVNENELF